MDRRRDAIGQLNWDYLRGREAHEIIERDDGYIEVSGGPASYFADHRDWPLRERRAMAWVRGRVLDIGCGPGRHSLWLQSEGHDVVGIDASPLTVRVARLRGLRTARVMTVSRLGFPPKSFDTILLLGNNFGLLGDADRGRLLLRRFRTLTTGGGRIIAESMDPSKTENPDHLAYHERNRRRGRLPGQVRMRIRYRGLASAWFDYLFVSKQEMVEILRGTGWRIRKTIRSGGTAYIAVLDREDIA
jgi:SAM-dependent methyltransferase